MAAMSRLVSRMFSRANRAAGALARMRFVPRRHSALLSLANDGDLGGIPSVVHRNTLLQLLSQLAAWGGLVYVETAARNRSYVATVIARYPNARMLLTPSRLFSWSLAVHDDSLRGRPRAREYWHLAYDYRPELRLTSEHFVVPYGMHPGLEPLYPRGRLRATIVALREMPRQRRVFFAGSTGRFYSTSRPSPALRHLMGRNEVLAALHATGAFREVRGPHELASLGPAEMLLVNADACRIPQQEWLPMIAAADFAICPPGCVMPMCFNIIEAMAVGTIPITNYPHWFHPRLKDGENCIAFDTAADLAERIEAVRTLSAARICAMRRAVTDYYDTHLAPGTLVRNIAGCGSTNVTLHVLDETRGHLEDSALAVTSGVTP